MTTLAPSLAAISRVVFQPWSVRTTVSVFCFKSAISASCFPGFTFSRVIKITDSSDMAYLLLRGRCPLTVDPGCPSRTTRAPHAAHPCVSDTPRTTRRVETDRDVESFLENPLEGVCAGRPHPSARRD